MSDEYAASAEFWQGRWPYDAEKVEMHSGCPHWRGGPYGRDDVGAAHRAFPDHRAEIGTDGYGLTLVPASWTWRVRARPSSIVALPPGDDDTPVTLSWHATRASAEAAVRRDDWVEQVSAHSSP